MSSSYLLLDNGGSTVKLNYNGIDSVIPNCCGRMNKQVQLLIADQVNAVSTGSSLNFIRPFDRGYLVNWGSEVDIWKRILDKASCQIDTVDCLIMTEPILNPIEFQNDYNEMIFEEFNFNSYIRRPAPWFSAYESTFSSPSISSDSKSSSYGIIIDAGFSFSHSVPYCDGKILSKGIRRVDIGGKLLTNYLKEIVSYRQWNMLDEFKLMDQVKEDLCFVTMDFNYDMTSYQAVLGPSAGRSHLTMSKSSVQKDYDRLEHTTIGSGLRKSFILPDFVTTSRGHIATEDYEVKPDDQVLQMETERFVVPELLFSPSDIGMSQAGVAEATMDGLKDLELAYQTLCLSNITLTGGSVQFPNFDKRYEKELRSLAPDLMDMNVNYPSTPDHYALQGMKRYSHYLDTAGPSVQATEAVSKAKYMEEGSHRVNDIFNFATYHQDD